MNKSYLLILIFIIVDFLIAYQTKLICDSMSFFQLTVSIILQIASIAFYLNRNKMKSIILKLYNKRISDYSIFFSLLCVLIASFAIFWGGVSGVYVKGGAYYCNGVVVKDAIVID